MINKYFNSKILLFGEYLILLGGDAFAIPFPNYYSFLSKNIKNPQAEESNLQLKQLLKYLLNLKLNINLTQLEADLQEGMYLESNIPQGYGLGSSGTLSAAILKKYAPLNMSKDEILQHLIEIESFFHGKSSGIDPFVSYFNQPIVFKSKKIDLINKPLNQNFNVYVLDSGIKRNTQKLVEIFKKKSIEETFINSYISPVLQYNQNCIESIINKENLDFQSLKQISILQYKWMAEFIPEEIQRIWNETLDSNDIAIKLCGAGGGGFFLLISKTDNLFLKKYENRIIKVL